MPRGTALRERADDDLDYPASRGADAHRCHDAGVGIHGAGKRREQDEPRPDEDMRNDRSRPDAYPVHEFGADEVDDELDGEIDGYEQGQLHGGNAERSPESHIKKGREIVDYRLTDIARVTRRKSGLMIFERRETHTPVRYHGSGRARKRTGQTALFGVYFSRRIAK